MVTVMVTASRINKPRREGQDIFLHTTNETNRPVDGRDQGQALGLGIGSGHRDGLTVCIMIPSSFFSSLLHAWHDNDTPAELFHGFCFLSSSFLFQDGNGIHLGFASVGLGWLSLVVGCSFDLYFSLAFCLLSFFNFTL
jgi:hypothetical protein